MAKYPQAVVFDLDYTIWPCWCDTHLSPPLKLEKAGGTRERPLVVDSYGYKLQVYPDVPRILQELQDNGVQIYSASRTAAPRIARDLLSHFRIDGYFEDSEWGQGSKVRHLKRLAERNKIAFSEMCLFDDEMRNKDVERDLGVKFLHIPSERVGLTYEIFQRGMESWRKATK
ncbi:unnamed protein product [Kuraishia capsulata CBS 1993]|uniref:Magnesium-dependent phosphatase-1 n=1 Tax=Kuraishia capsulata CBS 1993 TaxID=1382522 RepID=W6MQQ8_9ASCO|nr:uncharacterized protein KUCA_T00004982001 [Kuraishia capsulata CBS 1993]CDK28996.1 unnamed protein product [Kuraishia capsulata CBS 1993]